MTQRLSRMQRSVSGAAGGVLLVAGGVAVFKTENTLGTVGLQALGGVFTYLGLTGIIPRRLTVGGNTVDYGDFAEEVVRGALEGSDASVKEAMALQVIETADRRVEDAADPGEVGQAKRLLRQAESALKANETLDEVRHNLPAGCIEYEYPVAGPEGMVYGLPGSTDAQRVLVTVMWSALRRGWLENYLGLARRYKGFGAFIFLGPGSDLPVVASLSPPLLALPWTGPEDTTTLRTVLTEAHRVATTGESPSLEMFKAGRT